MNKQELVTKVAEKASSTKKDATTFVEAIVESITEALADGDKVQLVGFGTFEVRDRSQRQGRNPQTGETITIPASKAPAFKASKVLKELVNN